MTANYAGDMGIDNRGQKTQDSKQRGGNFKWALVDATKWIIRDWETIFFVSVLLMDPFQKSKPTHARHCLIPYSKHVLDMGATSAFGANWDPITHFVSEQWQPPLLLDELLRRVYCLSHSTRKKNGYLKTKSNARLINMLFEKISACKRVPHSAFY